MRVGICILFVAGFSLQLANGGITKKDTNYMPIKYPGPIQEVSQTRYGTPDEEVPEPCRNQTFCTIKPPDYPQERFNKLFKGTKPLQQPTLIIETVGDRQGDPEEISDCEAEVSYKPLYKVRNKRGDWRTVVQAPEENYLQMVRLETCKGAGNACFTALPQAPDIKTFCKQTYSTWEFLVVSGDSEPVKEKVDLPICCSCHYKQTGQTFV